MKRIEQIFKMKRKRVEEKIKDMQTSEMRILVGELKDLKYENAAKLSPKDIVFLNRFELTELILNSCPEIAKDETNYVPESESANDLVSTSEVNSDIVSEFIDLFYNKGITEERCREIFKEELEILIKNIRSKQS